MDIPLLLGAGAVVGSVAIGWWAVSGSRTSRETIALGDMSTASGDVRAVTIQPGAGERTVERLTTEVGRRAARYAPRARLSALEQRLLLAGTPRGWTLERVLAAKVVLGASGAVFGLLRLVFAPSFVGFLLALLATAAGFFAPDLALRHKLQERQQLIRRALADAIDQLTVAVQAGLGLDAAIARVARTTEGPFASELSRVMQDTRAGMRRSDALAAMSDRVRLPELRQVVVALAQAEKLGVPVAQTLQVQAQELRIKRRQHAEEQAMKLPVKILFPMVMCILPCLFIVVLGPAAINIFETLGKA